MGDVSKTHLKWTIPNVKEGYSSPVIVGEYIYRLQKPEVLGCFRLATGEAVYSERMSGVSDSSSPIATSDGKIYLASAGN